MEAAYSEASAAMRLVINLLLAWPRTTKVVVGIGAVALLFYAASFYTRDWRPVVAQADQPAAAQATTRSKAEPRSSSGKVAELPTPIEPMTTGALTRVALPVAPSPAAETVNRELVSPLPRLQARPAAPRSPAQHKPAKRTQVAARPARVEETTPVGRPPLVRETPIHFQLADRGGNN
jgi:hypothetical protein